MLGYFYGKKFGSKNSPASEFYMPTFRNTIFYTYPPLKMEQCSETSAYKIQTQGNYREESIQHDLNLLSFSSAVSTFNSSKILNSFLGKNKKVCPAVLLKNFLSVYVSPFLILFV
jgi:hypothetical protein